MASGRGDRHLHSRGVKGLRLLLGGDRLQARHCPPSRPAALGSIVLMSARRVTNWTWPRVQVAVSRRLLLHARKVVQVMPGGDLQNIRRGPEA
jgi:hypothetical protein